ncbi:putative transcription factor C2H2 family [Helianthus annuus]|uniref:RING-type E3 ubiquitin transferase n=1 Tax=Helianthus annuus TaxID=4232 RepID=A0A251UBT7_HELAN|nr:probable E3 ubiquitin-protein ligase RHA4A [Helianthus annuus]KAF5797695.1 putative transcription factor C2H2 family [Helianthus annuus]KAJ0549390.1 putative transcription factor C2H2 family [Helianthus annuus]KAJ0555745.1 putative transcription factor C2H2 family [Helianthus annuus]KAJ0562345.1 putative transcription factor C2H2 family [Helianthus annuus]KAJ0727721.1 putative transcription factor C2H2 family [Helianthus annuus]
MGYLESSSTTSVVNSHLYSQALQMKIYQAFIFSIPILFSIILFLLFYLFYLKRTFSRRNSSSSSSIIHLRTSRTHDSSTLSQDGLKVNLEDKLTVIALDQDLYAKDSMCCVCLGEFEINEKLHQIPSCQHMFHGECIRNWLGSNTTCPLCRCSVVNTSKGGHHEPPVIPQPAMMIDVDSSPRGVVPLERSVVMLEGSSSSSMDNKLSHSNEESVVVNVQIHQS